MPEHAIFFVADLKRTNIALREAPPIVYVPWRENLKFELIKHAEVKNFNITTGNQFLYTLYFLTRTITLKRWDFSLVKSEDGAQKGRLREIEGGFFQ